MAGDDESHTNVDGLRLARSEAVEIGRGTVLAGRYEIEATLGRGGAGIVLRAHDRELREAVAIKVLRPDLGNAARWVERLAREVKLARQLRHPNVCRVFDFEKADGHVFIVMELATGGTLRTELDSGATRRRPEAARLADARAVAAGLAAIHDAGIAHRDVTPQNVLRMSDGRLVVSDFGLATEVSQTTTSIHGGTIAYMAPEVVRGQRASFASDVWALGIVIHEIVFGERPTWSKPVGGALAAPGGARPLTRGERLALDVCRACTSDVPARRPRSAHEVEASLEDRRHRRLPMGRALASLAILAALIAVAIVARRGAHPGGAKPADAFGYRDLTDRAADWTTTSSVIARYDDRIKCLTVLPDGHTVRLLWGHPGRPEDVDARTGARVPSPLVPAAYQESCPQISPDGRRLAFEGYTPDRRAFAFVSDRPDGRDAVPVVAIADPSMSSEPKWLPDSRSFTFDIDHQRMGLFSLDTRRTTVLPDATSKPFHSATRFAFGPTIFVAAGLGGPDQGEVVALEWPNLTERARFGVPGIALDLASRNGQTLFVTTAALKYENELWKIDLARRTRERLAIMRNHGFRLPAFTDAGFVFESLAMSSDAWTRGASGHFERATLTGDVVRAAACRGGLIVTRAVAGGLDIWRTDLHGRSLEALSSSGADFDAVCGSREGEWYVARASGSGGLYRCHAAGCERLSAEQVLALSMSPDGERIAFLQIRNTEPVAGWISRQGGEIHEIGLSNTFCGPGWSSNHSLWFSQRRDGQPTWVEIDADSLKETGRTVRGEKDCSDGALDPASPASPDLRVVSTRTAELRMVPFGALGP